MQGANHVTIIGAGPAGATCALYLKRADVECVVLDSAKTVVRTAVLNNYPGLDQMEGHDWLASVHSQLRATGVPVLHENVVSASKGESGFEVRTRSGERFRSEIVVLASGQAKADLCGGLGVPTRDGEQPYVRNNVDTDRWGRTVVSGIYACGVLAGLPSQVIVCAGSGATVAIAIASHLKGSYWVDHDAA